MIQACASRPSSQTTQSDGPSLDESRLALVAVKSQPDGFTATILHADLDAFMRRSKGRALRP